VQGLADDGIVEVSASAPGYYCESSFNVTLGPSGFYIDSPWSEFHTTPLSQDTEIVIALARLNPSTLEVIYEWPQPQLRGGLSSCSVMVQSNDPAVGNVTASPVVVYSGDSEVSTWFEPASAGIATVGIQQLPKFGGRSTEFSTPADMQEVTAYVDNPTINISDDAVGKNLQTLPSSYNHRLSVEAPAGGVDVTLTSQDPARVRLSPDGEAIGSADLVLHVPAGSRQIPPFYVQGLDDSGMVTVDAVASGFEAGEFGVVFYPAGFCIATPNSIHTTAFSDPSSIGIRSTRLAHGTMDTLEYQSVRGGASPVDVAITCSDTLVGTITTSPVVVHFGHTCRVCGTVDAPIDRRDRCQSGCGSQSCRCRCRCRSWSSDSHNRVLERASAVACRCCRDELCGGHGLSLVGRRNRGWCKCGVPRCHRDERRDRVCAGPRAVVCDSDRHGQLLSRQQM